jgi:hypothetical protein
MNKPIEPSEAALNALIAEQMANLPPWWENCEQHQGRGKTRRDYHKDRRRKVLVRDKRKTT